jgi:hypothetical protein
MLDADNLQSMGDEGYVYNSYGDVSYLKHAITSAYTLRRYDTKRPIALVCDESHQSYLIEHQLQDQFDHIEVIDPEHASIVGFKHNLHHYLFFKRNLYLDSDIIWCKDPDSLWQSLSPNGFTITGNQVADSFFGGPKNAAVVLDVLLQRRKRTLKHFDLTYLSRVQTGMMYASDYELTRDVCELAQNMLDRQDETHFRSRKLEEGRTEESCEWSLGMAMSKLNIPIYPWFLGNNSPQLDFIADLTRYDEGFHNVECTYYCDPFIYSLRGLKSTVLRNILIRLFSLLPGKSDYLKATPYCLHFGWYHQKGPFYEFSDRVLEQLTDG